MALKLTVVDDNDKVVGSAFKKDIHKNGWNFRCSFIFLFNKKGEILIGKRPSGKLYANTWTYSAGGKVDEGESYEVAAHRELKEELGIDIPLKKIVNNFWRHESKGKVFFTVFQGRCENGFVIDKEEIATVKWVSFKFLQKDIKKHPEKYMTPFIVIFESFMKAKIS